MKFGETTFFYIFKALLGELLLIRYQSCVMVCPEFVYGP